MRKYKQILLLAIFGMVSLCYSSDALSVEKYFTANDANEDEIEVMLRTLERERVELGKLKSEFKGAFKMTEEVIEVPIKKEVEKKVVLAHFVKKSGKKNKRFVDIKNGEAKGIITIENEGEYVEESEKVEVDEENEILHPFEIAENLYKLGEYQTALDIYQLVINNNITNEKKMWISYQIANCYRRLSSYNEAVEAYGGIQEDYAGTYWAKQAQWHIQDILWRSKVEKKIDKVVER
ncbi:MAG: tetratricopeptide repeat protein [Candidatus Scalindua sp.]|nr:tetratricopeptide repeat protein [Candidatus Scalindua sp.]